MRDTNRKLKDLKGDSDRMLNTHSEYVTKNEINHQRSNAVLDQLISQQKSQRNDIHSVKEDFEQIKSDLIEFKGTLKLEMA